MSIVVVLGTMDTKGYELAYVRDVVAAQDVDTLLVDMGVIEPPPVAPDITRQEVARLAGINLDDIVAKRDRGEAVAAMTAAARIVARKLFEEGRLQGIISLGGSAGTTIGTAAMQVLPVGVPKVMVSTLASGDTRPYVGTKDIAMMYSVVDISGLNRLSRHILANAALAVAGMVKGEIKDEVQDKPLLAATMFGVTTPCVTKAREYLEHKGYEVLVFHATGSGGKAMEGLIEDGFISGVLDITTTEWCDELVGGVLTAGPQRLEAAGKMGIPQVVSVGALDMVNFGPPDTVPVKFSNRRFYQHNPTVTLMRTTKEECAELGKIIADKLNAAQGPTIVMLPLKGVSMIDAEGKAFYDPEADATLFATLKENLRPGIHVVELDNNINDPEFSLALAQALEGLLAKR